MLAALLLLLTTTTLPASPSLPCAACHVEIAAEHAGSRHGRSADNALFRAGFARERHERCASCHAPVDDDAWRLLRGQPPAHDGVDCAACHVRDGVVWSAKPARGYGHVVGVDGDLGSDDRCARCHEFVAHEVSDGVTRLLPAVPLQTTASEHRAYRAAGGGGTCVSCHMPVVDGRVSHAIVAGAHDIEALRAALVVDIAADGRAVTLSSRGVGHRYPTGDLFRRLVVSVDEIDVATIGVPDGLIPGERRTIPLPRGRRLQIRYHRADDAEEARGAISFDALVSELVALPLPRGPR